MDENAFGKLLPNLKVTLGKDSDSDNQIEEGEISDAMDESDKSDGEKTKVDVVRTWMNTLKNPKVYENKAGAFITGLDLSSEVLIKKLQQRAERFGLKRKDEPVTQNEIDALYKSLGIEPENITSCKLKSIRLEALHMRGVEEMDTNDVFAYFGDYGPASVEWINDFSCNVVWLDTATTARAMIGVSRPLIIKKKGATNQGIMESLMQEGEVKSLESEDIIELSDSEENDKKECKVTVKNCMEVDYLFDPEKPDDTETNNYQPEELGRILDVPVPPGLWRLGVPYYKSAAILLRFATKDDKKLPGAEKRSTYYQKYGNPNYGGLKGKITKSKKRNWNAAKTRQVVEQFYKDSTSRLEIKTGETSNNKIKSNNSKMPRMRMYADEEEKKKKGSFMRHESGQSIHSRLGTKYTKDELFQLGNRFASASEEENLNVPGRLNVWTDIAMSMSKEDNFIRQSNSLDMDPFEGSRPWRASRDESSKYLRSSLSFQRRQSPLNRPQEDLRYKIKRMKKEDVKKHRSPMCKDD